MYNDFLRSDDYLKVLQFIESIQIEDANFGMQILYLLSNIFGYKKSDFWLTDGKGNLSSPVSTIGDSFINDYLNENYKKDGLHPQNIGVNYAIRNHIGRLTDLVPPSSFDQSEYCKFLNKYGLYRELGIALSISDRLIGCIDIFRSKKENDFSAAEINTLKILSGHISRGLYSHQLYFNKEYEKKLFEAFADKSSTGMIICDIFLNVYYFNKSSKDICYELLANERFHGDPIEFFIKEILAETRNLWRAGYENIFYTNALYEVRINVLPTFLGNTEINRKNLFTIMLSYENTAVRNKFDFLKLNSHQNLSIRERQVLNLILQGKTNQEVSEELYISPHTVKKYMGILFEKFKVKNRTSLICKAMYK